MYGGFTCYRPAWVGGNPTKSIHAFIAVVKAARCTFGIAHVLLSTCPVFLLLVCPQPRRPLVWTDPTHVGRCFSHPSSGVCSMTLSRIGVAFFIRAVMLPVVTISTTSLGLNNVSCIKCVISCGCVTMSCRYILWVSCNVLCVISCG